MKTLKQFYRIFLLLMLIFSISVPRIFSQNTISEITQDDGRFWKGIVPINVYKSSGKPYKMGQGVAAYYPALKKPQRIAIVSFYLYDFGSSESVHFGNYNALGWEQYKSKFYQLTDDGAKKIANLFYYSWITDEKKNSKAANNVEIITPDEFTPEQNKIYNDFKGKATGFGMWVSQEDNAGTILECADNYKPIIVGSPSDYKISEALRLLAKDLGVDAVVIVTTEVMSDKTGTLLKAVGMYMYGPNPVPKQEGVKYIGFNGAGRQEGNVYQLFKIKFKGDNGVPFYTIDKKTKEKTLNINGIELIYSKILGGIYYQLVTVNKCGVEK